MSKMYFIVKSVVVSNVHPIYTSNLKSNSNFVFHFIEPRYETLLLPITYSFPIDLFLIKMSYLSHLFPTQNLIRDVNGKLCKPNKTSSAICDSDSEREWNPGMWLGYPDLWPLSLLSPRCVSRTELLSEGSAGLCKWEQRGQNLPVSDKTHASCVWIALVCCDFHQSSSISTTCG